MTIHRALSELKLMDAKIEKQIAEIVPTGVYQTGKLINGLYKPEDFEKDAQSKLDSITALIERKQKIKTAIVFSNSNTTVEVAKKSMTVADAITMKALVNFKKALITALKARHQKVVGELNRLNEQVQGNVQKLLEATYGKDQTKVKPEDMDAVRKPYLEGNEFHLSDPIKVKETIENLEKEVMEFESEVDAVLSESNAVTIINVD